MVSRLYSLQPRSRTSTGFNSVYLKGLWQSVRFRVNSSRVAAGLITGGYLLSPYNTHFLYNGETMPLYRCNVCNTFEYEPGRGSSTTGIKPGTEPEQFPDGWNCPICGADRTHLTLVPREPGQGLIDRAYICRVCGSENPVPRQVSMNRSLPHTRRGGQEKQILWRFTWKISIPWPLPVNQSLNR